MSTTAINGTVGKQLLNRRDSGTPTSTPVQTASAVHSTWAERMETVGRQSTRYGLVVVLFWIGGMKFTAYEAEGITGFIANSPLMSWAYSVFSVQGFSAVLGAAEIVIALFIASRPFSARAALLGSASAVGMFLTTLSFLLTTPDVWEASAGGFPALSVVPGQFLVKDLVLLGAALWLFGENWRAVTASGAQQQQGG
jgi:uncharacterized membrane protein YkgB